MRYYLPQTNVEANFNGGICRDTPPSSIPQNYCYDSVDFNLEKPGVAYYRGPLKFYGQPFGGAASTDKADWISVPRLNDHGKVFVQWDGHLYDATAGAEANIGALNLRPMDRPKVFPGSTDVLVIPAGDGTTGPSKVSLSAGTFTPVLGTLGGSPPPGRLVAIHQNRVVLAGTTANPNRVYFSPVPIEDPWNDPSIGFSFIDTSHPITAIASVQGVLLVFSQSFCERIIGDVPPGYDGENMSIQPLGATGCISPLSIQSWGTNIIFANAKGIYVTNGAGFDSLTDKTNGTGIGTFWTGLEPSAQAPFGVVGAIYNQKFYIITVGTNTLVCYLPTKAWWRFSTLSFIWADSSSDILGRDEVYHIGRYAGAAGTSKCNQVVTCSGMFHPFGAGADDVPWTPPSPQLVTRMIGDGLGLKAYEHGHITLISPGQVEMGYIKGASMEQAGSDGFGTAVHESPFTSNTALGTRRVQRQRFTLNFDAQGIYLNAHSAGDVSLVELQIAAFEVEVREATYGNISDAVFP
jgi:hypothetical protein